jgi:hypothetical protein
MKAVKVLSKVVLPEPVPPEETLPARPAGTHCREGGTHRLRPFGSMHDEPAQALMLIEAGPAVYLLEGGHLRAAHAFLNGLSPGDRVWAIPEGCRVLKRTGAP